PTGSTPLMPLYHRYHLHRFVDGHVLVSPPQGLSIPEPRPSITVGGLAVYGRGHGNSARAAAGRSRGTAPGRTPPSRAAAPERTAPQLPGGGTACTYARGAGRDRGAGADRPRCGPSVGQRVSRPPRRGCDSIPSRRGLDETATAEPGAEAEEKMPAVAGGTAPAEREDGAGSSS